MAKSENLPSSLSLVRQHWLPNDQSIEQYLAFEARYGSAHARLACHAAFPLIVTPELVNLIRINFLSELDIDWIAEADFLLAFCRPIDVRLGLYEIDPGLREIMLEDLQESETGIQRLYELADFLLAYNERYAEPFRHPDIARIHQWISWSYLYPEKIVAEMNTMLQVENSEDKGAIQLSAHQIHLTTMIEVMRNTFEFASPMLEKQYQALLEKAQVIAYFWYRGEGSSDTLVRDVKHLVINPADHTVVSEQLTDLTSKPKSKIQITGGVSASRYARKLARQLGYEIIKQGHSLLTYEADGIDEEVRLGALEACQITGRDPREWISIFYPKIVEPFVHIDYGKTRVIGEDYQECRQYVIGISDAVIILSGGDGTSLVVNEAKVQQKPVIPIGATGGVAEKLWDMMLVNEKSMQQSYFRISQEYLAKIGPNQTSEKDLIVSLINFINEHIIRKTLAQRPEASQRVLVDNGIDDIAGSNEITADSKSNTKHSSSQRFNIQFGQLLTTAIYRISTNIGRRITVVSDEFGYALGRKGGSYIEYLRRGHIPSQPNDLELLARILVDYGGLDRNDCVQFLQLAGYQEALAFTQTLFPFPDGATEPRTIEIPNLSESVLLISSSSSDRISTGFAIHQDDKSTFVLTAAHAIEDVNSLRVDHLPAVVTAIDSELDMAVLRVDSVMQIPIFRLNFNSEPMNVVSTAGIYKFGRNYLAKAYRVFPDSLREETLVLQKLQMRTKVWTFEVDDELHAGFSGAPLVDTSGAVVAIVTGRQANGKTGLAILLEALPKLWVDMPLAVQPNKSLKSNKSEPLMNCNEELTAFEKIASGQDNHSQLIIIQGNSGVGKTRLISEFQQIASKNQLSICYFAISPIDNISEFLGSVVESVGVQYFPTFNSNAARNLKFTKDMLGKTHFYARAKELTRQFFFDLNSQQVPRIAMFIDQYEKADLDFKEWFRRVFLTSVKHPRLTIVIATQTELEQPFSSLGELRFKLTGVSLESFRQYAASLNVQIAPQDIEKFHTLLQGIPKFFVDYIYSLRQQAKNS